MGVKALRRKHGLTLKSKIKPFPVKADEAVEVVRVADSVKRKTEFSVKR
jgi:hypothetical protein